MSNGPPTARGDPEWANRHRLLRARERLTDAQFARMWNQLLDGDESGQIVAAWIAKEELRALCAVAQRGGYRHEISHRLWRFYDWCATTSVPEVHTLAETHPGLRRRRGQRLQQTSIAGVFAARDMARRPQMPSVGAQVGIAAAVTIDQELALAAFAANHGEPE